MYFLGADYGGRTSIAMTPYELPEHNKDHPMKELQAEAPAELATT
jgi:hypothetical protein